MQGRAFEDTKHLEYSHRAPCDFLCTAIRQVHLTMNKPETVHARVKWRLGSSNQCILGYTSVLSSFQSDASLRVSNSATVMNAPLLCPAPLSEASCEKGLSSTSPKTIQHQLAGITTPCDYKRLWQMCMDWIETLARDQHNREQSNNTKTCICVLLRQR